MKAMHIITFLLTVVGALNWGLIGLGAFMGSNWNVVGMVLGSWPEVEWLVYVLVGLSALYLLVNHRKDCRACS